MKLILLAFVIPVLTLGQDDVYRQQKAQVESVIKYLEAKCSQTDPQKRKQDCPDPSALDSYKAQLKTLDSFIEQVDEGMGGREKEDTPKVAAPKFEGGGAKGLEQSFCSYESYPTELVGETSAGLLARASWTNEIKKNDLFTLDYRILEKDLEKLGRFKKDLSCKVSSDCELILLSEKICPGGSSQIVISKNDRELQKFKDQVKSISQMAHNLVAKEVKAKICPVTQLAYSAQCEECKCVLKVKERIEGVAY